MLDLTQYDKELTLKPKINEKSEKIVQKKQPNRKTTDDLY